ncbi:putative ABC transport system permease protein [Scopulibacillus darangshiensis]|uniref:Putative ABC transport system permease protein n=1 Tax=Scopulibacillus darangshiensis TaxID=442528 RepID=A0A4R2P9P0_9BACL|nr:ABC transporter permease [Scopulibacillus darangshiensis]TCP30585.1 putative ABC transport system permease protein [Scopulibacillus darangshiensis]
MTLFSIARKNIKRNFYNYFLYFASMIFSIVIFFTFVSLQYNDQVAEASTMKISTAFKGASIVLIIFVGIFIWYSNAFFTRRRKKEVALYSLLGVRKRQIGKMLFYENFVMGLFALIIGVVLGTLLSKFFVMLLMKMMGFAVDVAFMISGKAILETVIVFAIIILITSFEGYRLIYRFKLIDLFHAEKKGESAPKASVFAALLAIIFLAAGYFISTQTLTSKLWLSNILMTALIILASVTLGTFLLFRSLTIYMIKLSKKNRSQYYKGINIIGTSQLLYRIKGNARILTIIALLSAVTLCAIGTSYSMFYNAKQLSNAMNPFSYAYISQGKPLDQKVHGIINHQSDHQPASLYSTKVIKQEINIDWDKAPNGYFMDRKRSTFLSNSAFNQLAKTLGQKGSLHLKGDAAVALDNQYSKTFSPHYRGKTLDIKTNDGREKLHFVGFKDYNVINSNLAGFPVVVSDQLFQKLVRSGQVQTIKQWQVKNDTDSAELTKRLASILPKKAEFTDFYRPYKDMMAGNGMLMFLGAFLGLVFLLATGSIIYFKQLTEAAADKERYDILKKIGVTKKEIRHSIAKQMLFIFSMPLGIGILHSAFALSALSDLMGRNILAPVLISMGVYTVIYIMYYFLTVNSYFKLVTQGK